MTMDEPPRVIVELRAENVKRLKAVTIRPDHTGTVVIAGANAQGKSSVLDAVWLALGGATAGKTTPRPVRDGQPSARVRIDLGDLVVERKWTAAGTSSLTVTSKDGARYPSPQAVLDQLVGRFAMDPLTFVGLPAKQQRQALLDLVELPFDPDQLAERRAQWYAERTDLNREVRRLGAAALSAGPVPDPVEPVSVSELAERAHAARRVEQDRHTFTLALSAADAHIEGLRRALETAEADRARFRTSLEELPEPVDVEAVYADLDRAQERNARAAEYDRQRRQREVLDQQYEQAAAQAEERTQWLDAQDDYVRAILEEAAMPVPGLGFDDDGVTYQGVPFGQASSAEQLRVSCAIAMSARPNVRVMRVENGSLLDSAHLAILKGMAAEHGWQVWLERVDESGTVGVVIEDGEVRA